MTHQRRAQERAKFGLVRHAWVLDKPLSVGRPTLWNMIIDCDNCVVRDIACSDCIVSVILSSKANSIDEKEEAAFALLSSRGLVPPLRFSENSQSLKRVK